MWLSQSEEIQPARPRSAATKPFHIILPFPLPRIHFLCPPHNTWRSPTMKYDPVFKCPPCKGRQIATHLRYIRLLRAHNFTNFSSKSFLFSAASSTSIRMRLKNTNVIFRRKGQSSLPHHFFTKKINIIYRYLTYIHTYIGKVWIRGRNEERID